MSVYFLIDTNTYLHYRFFDNIDWLNLFGCSEATLLVPMTVIIELDQKKFVPDDKIRTRASSVIKRLEDILYNSEKLVRPNIMAEKYNTPLRFNWSKEGLSKNTPDDQIIACALSLKKSCPSDRIIIVTADLGMRLKCQNKVEVFSLPDEYKDDREDKNIKKVAELTKQLHKYQNASPKLKLIFTNSKKSNATYGIKPSPKAPGKNELDAQIEALEQKHKYIMPEVEPPEQQQTAPQALGDFLKMAAALNSRLTTPSKEEISRYEKELKDFLEEYREYLLEKHNYNNFVSRTMKLELTLSNIGQAVAEDIDIFLHFPDGFDLLEKESLPKKPKEPTPPTKPRTLTQISVLPQYNLSSMLPPSFDLKNMPQISDISISIKKTNSYDVRYQIVSLKHYLERTLDPLFISFPSYEEAKGFSIDYNIIISNSPEKISGKLHVKIQKY